MEPNTKSKGFEGKIVLKIVIIVVIVLGWIISSPASASMDYNVINIGDTNVVLTGQKLQFQGSDIGKTIKGDPDNEDISYFRAIATTDFDSSYYFFYKWGAYFIDDGDGKLEINGDDTVLYVTRPHLDLELKIDSRQADVISKGRMLKIDLDTNLNDDDSVELEIMDNDGNILRRNPTDGTPFYDITIGDLHNLKIKTDAWDLGDYTFSIRTIKEKACGLDMRSNTKSLYIVKGEVWIKVDMTAVAETEPISLTVFGMPHHDIIISSSDASHTIFKGGINDYLGPDTCGPISDSIDVDGKRKYAAIFNETGTYTLTVKDITDDLEDSVDITVTEKAAVIDVPVKVVIGEDLKIEGCVNAGKYVDIAINDEIVPKLNDVVTEPDDTFRVEIRTNAGYAPGALKTAGPTKIKVYIDRAASGNIQPNEKEDGSVEILMVSGSLTVTLSNSETDLGSHFVVNGTAPGSKNVEILTISPKGGRGVGLNGNNPLPNTMITGITYVRTPVFWDYTFSKDISVSKYADPGMYIVAVLTPGNDGKYNGINSDNILDITDGRYGDLSIKTQDQIVSILRDGTVGAKGSDDLVWMDTIKVGTPSIVKRIFSAENVIYIIGAAAAIVTLFGAIWRIMRYFERKKSVKKEK